MLGMLRVVLFVALTGSHCGYGLPVRPTPENYPHDERPVYEGWGPENGLYAAIPALALVLTAAVLIFGCTWCYRHKDCKLFTASASHLHAAQRVAPPDSGFSEPSNNNISEDNNNGPISLREMQNIANNNAAAYIVSENEERNRISRESVVEFEPLPTGFIGADPLEHCADWFGGEDFPRHNLQYLREIGRGWFGRVVEGEIEEAGTNTTVAVKILNQNASLEDKARFLDESKVYRDVSHEHILAFIGKYLQEDPWILIFELCSMDLQQYLISNRPQMAILNERGVPLRLMCDVTSALAYLHSRGYTYGRLFGGSVLVRGAAAGARAVLGRYAAAEPPHDGAGVAPEALRPDAAPYNASSEIWSVGALIWEICAWGSEPAELPSPPPDLPCPYKNHLYQVMQLCWNLSPEARPTAAQVHALVNHLHTTHTHTRNHATEHTHSDLYANTDFEERWQRLKPNTIPKIDEHVAIVHAPSTSMTSHFTGSDQEFDNNTLSVDMDTAVSRSSSIMSDKDPLSIQIKSESLTNLHGSLEDVRNIYLTHNETAALECHQGNIHLEDIREKEQDRSDSSVDPWLKDIIAGSQDDVSYYKDVSDVIKNLDNILNSEKTSSSESSHQASPSRDNLSLDCKKEYPAQSCLVKSPGISNFQNILDTGFGIDESEPVDEEVDRETIGTLSHSFERHTDTISQQTLENLTPDTPMKDFDVDVEIERLVEPTSEVLIEPVIECEIEPINDKTFVVENSVECTELSKVIADNVMLKAKEIVDIEKPQVEEIVSIEELKVKKLVDNEISKAEKIVDSVISKAEKIVYTEISKAEEEVDSEISRSEEIVDNKIIPKLKELCESSMPSVSEKQSLVRKDCETPCDNITEIRTDEETKSIDVERVSTDSKPLETEVTESVQTLEQMEAKIEETKVEEIILPVSIDETSASNEGSDTLPSVTDDSNIIQGNETSHVKIESNLEDIDPGSSESENNYSKDETMLVSDLIDTATDSSKDQQLKNEVEEAKNDFEVYLQPVTVTPEQIPVSVQSLIDEKPATIDEIEKAHSELVTKDVAELPPTHLPPAVVQNTDKQTPVHETETLVLKEVIEENEKVDSKENDGKSRSDSNVVDINEQSGDSTVYMDLINNTNSQIIKDNTVDNNVYVGTTRMETTPTADTSALSRDSTVYLDLPSFEVMKMTDDFLHMERSISSKQVDEKIFASTPIASDNSAETLDNTIESSVKDYETIILSETKVPEHEPGVSVTKLEQRYVPDSMCSPFESPSHKSHHTDTYDENSSVVLGPFENCTLELFKGVKSAIDPVELPKEELLAFSSNFSEMNLATPSPLRDGNFLNEVPDIISDDIQFDDLASISEPKVEPSEPPSEDTGSGSATERRVSPSTPPNSPGVFLASTSQQKYLVDIDLNDAPPEPDISLRDEIDLNQIELQITSKLAMAENENNLNIEYSGPLTVEGLIEEGGGMRESDAIPESYLAGNGGSAEDAREELSLDEECVQALRNELELKLPLAQVATIEPQCEGEWSSELPPPPELVVSYPGALSPIAEETGQQLSAYENDANWNPSTRTDSSESYPEPCNNSTDSVTELPCGAQSTDTAASRNNTYTVHRDVARACSSRELTMSADSLNASPQKTHKDETPSPIDDKTYVKDDERESNCERISQVSPFLVSPTTDTSAPDTSDNCDNATGVSTLSKTTLPTDAKHSKPETQCLSKATSIDSWCSNDTLYNVEENFDDLAMDSDLPLEFEAKDEGNSESTDTLTHNDEDKEHSHCSTYIIHDSQSEPCETFSPDSITANDNCTYTKVKTEAAKTPPSVDTKSDVNDSTKNTTKDLAYGSLISGMPSFSNCTTELASGLEEAWKLPQPELVRRSPIGDMSITPPKHNEVKECSDEFSPQIASEPCIKKMDSVDISCLRDSSISSPNQSETENQEYNRNMAPSVTSTPFTEQVVDEDSTEVIPMTLPEIKTENSEYMANVPSFHNFQQSAEVRPQDLSNESEGATNPESEILLEGDSKTLSRNSNRDSLIVSEQTPNYSDFENSAVCKPQDMSSRDKSSQSMESGISSEEFRHFESSVRSRPQDLSSLIDASSMLLKSERMSSEIAMSSFSKLDQTSQSNSRINEPMQSLDISPPSITNLIESHELVNPSEPSSTFLINFDIEDESEQPHSIIVTEVPMKISPNRSYDSHAESHIADFNHTYDSHEGKSKASNERNPMGYQLNGDITNDQPESLMLIEPAIIVMSQEIEEPKNVSNDISLTINTNDLTNGGLHETELNENFTSEVPELNGGPTEAKPIVKSEKYATVNFLSETFEELIESNVDDKLSEDEKSPIKKSAPEIPSKSQQNVTSSVIDKSIESSKDKSLGSSKDKSLESSKDESLESFKDKSVDSNKDQRLQNSTESLRRSPTEPLVHENGVSNSEGTITEVTEDFLQNEKIFCTLDSYFPMLSDIRFSGPASEIMSTSFQDSPSSPTSPECEQDSNKPPAVADILKEWDSDTDSHSSNSSSGEFIWKDGDGHETSVVPSTHFDHQRGSGPPPGRSDGPRGEHHSEHGGSASDGSADSGSGSEGDEVEFVPSSWDCRAAPAKSSLRSLQQVPPDNKKRVVFKRQKYHCVYEYPREAPPAEPHSPAYLPDLSTYCEWDPSSAEEAALCYGQLFASPAALGGYGHPLRAGIAFGPDYDEDFFISSSARPFESLGIMSTTSQFFPGMHMKRSLLERDLSDDVTDEFLPPPSPLPTTTLIQSRTPSLDFTTPDSGVEDITPGSTTDEEFKAKKLQETELTWRPDSSSSSESVSPSSPGELGGLRHTRDKLKLDLPPSPHVPSPRHNRVFNFVLDKPKRRQEERPPEIGTTPLVMTDDTPVVSTSLPVEKEEELPLPEPTFSTFGKSVQKLEPEQKIILTDEETTEVKDESPKVVEPVKGEGTVLDSGDEDSGIESSSKATLERSKTNVS